MKKFTSYLEVSSELELAEDESGNPTAAYVEISTEHSDDVSEDAIHQISGKHLQMVAHSLGCDPSFLRLVTEEEYLCETEECEIDTAE